MKNFKLNMTKIFYFVLLHCLCGFAKKDCCCYQSPTYVQLADSLTSKTAKILEKQKKLELCGTNGKMMDDIKTMGMSFDFWNDVQLKEARALIVGSIQEYLKSINSEKDIRPFLNNFPFEAKNIEIRIWFHMPTGENVAKNKINYVSEIDGIISYYINEEKYNRQPFLKETYAEALELLR